MGDVPEGSRLHAGAYHYRVTYTDRWGGTKVVPHYVTGEKLGRGGVVTLAGGLHIFVDSNPGRPPRPGRASNLQGHQI